MRNTIFIQCAVALATTLFIGGCSDNDDAAQGGNKQGITTTEAVIPEPLQWNTDNTIALYAKKADAEKTLFYTEESQVNRATFEAVKKAFPTPQEGDYIRAFYPAGKAKEKANVTGTLLPAPVPTLPILNTYLPKRKCHNRASFCFLLYVWCQHL